MIQPAAGNKHAGDGVDEANNKTQEASALLVDEQEDGLDVVLDEDAGHEVRVLGNGIGLAGCCVLVGEDHILGVLGMDGAMCGGVGVDGVPAAFGVDGRHDGEEILVFVIVVVGGGDCFVEGVEEGGIMRAEGEFGDHVGEVEGCFSSEYQLDQRPVRDVQL